jgi:hypothetical protein
MTDYNKNEDYGYGKGDKEEAEIAVDAVPAPHDGGPPIAPGHQRFYCEKCRAVRRWGTDEWCRDVAELA